MAEGRHAARGITEPVQHHIRVSKLDAFGVEAEMTAQRGLVDASLAATDDHDLRRQVGLDGPPFNTKSSVLMIWSGATPNAAAAAGTVGVWPTVRISRPSMAWRSR